MSTYKTKDLNQAAFMWCQQGAKLKQVIPEGNKSPVIFFVFELPITDEELKTLLVQYANNDTVVEPQLFVAKQGNLRDMLHGCLATKKKKEIV